MKGKGYKCVHAPRRQNVGYFFFFQINILQSIIIATIETRNYLKIVTNWPLNVDIHFEVKNRFISQRGGAGDMDRFQNLFSLL